MLVQAKALLATFGSRFTSYQQKLCWVTTLDSKRLPRHRNLISSRKLRSSDGPKQSSSTRPSRTPVCEQPTPEMAHF